MLRKMIHRGAVLGAVALAAAACFNFEDVGSKYEANVLIHYEPDYSYQYEDFLSQLFNGGKDSIAVNEALSYGPTTHYAKVDADGKLLGGFALCTGIDTLVAPDRKPSRFAVYDNGGCDGSLAYAVFHDTLATEMPEADLKFYVPNEQSACTPMVVYVQNVQAVAQAALLGHGPYSAPFGADDYLTLTITGYLKGKATGSKTVKLVSGTTLLEKWTEVDLSSLSVVDELDFHLEASRTEFPLYCCIDNLYFHYLEVN